MTMHNLQDKAIMTRTWNAYTDKDYQYAKQTV